jgi:heme oxygenase
MHPQAHDVGAPSLLEALRSGTGQLHVALEKRLPFFSPQLDAAWYRRLLQAYYGFYRPMESTLYDAGLIPGGFDQALREKTPTLHTDLIALGVANQAIAALPLCLALPRLDTPAACLGALYVLEGATLGGQVLRREMARRRDRPALERLHRLPEPRPAGRPQSPAGGGRGLLDIQLF